MSNDNEPNVNIQNGTVTPTGGLADGQPFYWYNPTSSSVTLENCGTWCEDDTYDATEYAYTPANILQTPNTNGMAWTESPDVWTGGGTGPYVTTSSAPSGPNTPNVNIQTGEVNGSLVNGQAFYWYNPTAQAVTLFNCGTWCQDDSYQVPAAGYAEAALRTMPNDNAFAWTEDPNEWNTPGMPHTQGPVNFPTEKDKEVA